MCRLIKNASKGNKIRIQAGNGIAKVQYNSDSQTKLTDITFTRKGIALYSRK